MTNNIMVQGWGYSVSRLNEFLVDLFDRYAELLKRRFSEDFQEVSESKESEKATIAVQEINFYRLSLPMIICLWPSIPGRSMKRLLTLAGAHKTKISKTSRKFYLEMS